MCEDSNWLFQWVWSGHNKRGGKDNSSNNKFIKNLQNIYWTYQKASLKKCVLSNILKVLKFSSLWILMAGKLFYSFGAAAKKAQSPSVAWVITLGAC